MPPVWVCIRGYSKRVDGRPPPADPLVVDTVDSSLELARLADAPAIAAMSCRLIEAGLAPSWPAERVTRHIRGAESLVLTARRAGRLLGFGIMQYGETTAHLNLLAVEPWCQRRGLGRALISWLEGSAVVAGAFLIQLELRASNADAHAFYVAQGFADTGRVTGYYQHREDAIQMAKDLSVAPRPSSLAEEPTPPDTPGGSGCGRDFLARLGLDRARGSGSSPPSTPPS